MQSYGKAFLMQNNMSYSLQPATGLNWKYQSFHSKIFNRFCCLATQKNLLVAAVQTNSTSHFTVSF